MNALNSILRLLAPGWASGLKDEQAQPPVNPAAALVEKLKGVEQTGPQPQEEVDEQGAPVKTAQPAAAGQPKEGDKRTEGGKEQRYDGKAWVDAPLPKEGDLRGDVGKQEKFDGKEWKPVPPPVTSWKDGEKEYTPEQLRKALRSASEEVKRMAEYNRKATDLKKAEGALEPVFKLAEALSKNPDKISILREVVLAELGEDGAKLFDVLGGLKRSELKDPREEEYTAREAAVRKREDRLEYIDKLDSIRDREKLSGEEMDELDRFCVEYYQRMEADENLPFLGPEDLYDKSPVRERKLRAAGKAEAEQAAADAKKREEEAARLKQNKPPTSTAGAGQEVKPGTIEDVYKRIQERAPQS